MQVKQKIIIPISILLFVLNNNNSYASNIDTTETVYMNKGSQNNGSGYWQSSNIREWLNSEDDTVKYTLNPPDTSTNGIYAYDNEKGFLKNFSEDEKNAIATTRRRVFVSEVTSPQGGNLTPDEQYPNKATSNSFGDLISNWKRYYYQIVNDKVFYLNTVEYFYYIESRDLEIPKN